VGSQEELKHIVDALQNFKEQEVIAAIENCLEQGILPLEIIEKGLTEGLRIIGDRYGKGELFLPHLLVSAKIVDSQMRRLAGKIGDEGAGQIKADAVVGTVEGDVHDLGKNLVSLMLGVNGYRIHDLGKDVPASAFVEKTRETGAGLVCLSSLMTSTMGKQEEVIDALGQSGLREAVRVVVGGAPVTEAYAKSIGADAYGVDALDAVRVCDRLLGFAAE